MKSNKIIEQFVKECAESAGQKSGEKFVGWESLIAVLVYQGLKLLLPQIKEWFKLGTAVMVLKRQEIKKKLVQYAVEKELDFPQAERAAEVVSDRLDDNTLKDIVDALSN
jgi:hypothetical protein